MIKKTAHVINIIDDKTIIIDFGLYDSAEVGQNVRIIEKGESISNLEGEEIGTLDLIKDELKITEVYENFSLCQKIKETTVTSPVFALSQINLTHTKKTVQTLNINPDDISDIKFPKNSPIKKGDIAEIFY